MSKFFKIIGYTAIILLGLVTFSGNSYAQEECIVSPVKFSEINGAGNFDGNNTNLTLQTSGCEDGITLKLKSLEGSEHRPAKIDEVPYLFFPDTEGKIKINFEIGEDVCYTDNQDETSWGFHCISYIEIYSGDTLVFSAKNNPNLTQTYVRTTPNSNNILRDFGILIGNCSDSVVNVFTGMPQYCAIGDLYEDDNDNWKFESVGPGTSQNKSSSCNITKNDISFSGVGEFIKDASPMLTIRTPGCENIPLKVSIVEEDAAIWWGDSEINIDYKDKEEIEFITLIPEEEVVKLIFKSTEENCDTSSEPDNCRIYVVLEYNNKFVSTEEFLDNRDNNLIKGIILADCGEIDGRNCYTSDGSWELKIAQGIKDEGLFDDSININLLDLQEVFDQDSPCYQNIDGVESYKEDCYELLAPIPGIGEDVKNNGRFSIDFSNYQLGQYIQSLFNVALGMLMLLSVIMIIVAGVEYMTVESIFGKSRAKSRITGAATGLILGLGIFIILRTINPQLLEINFGSNIDTVTLAHDDPAELNQNGSYNTGSEVNINGQILTSPNREGSTYTINGTPIIKGADWPVEGLVSIRSDLEVLGIKVNKKECAKVGDGNCTSVYFEQEIANEIINKMNHIAFNCACSITVTGGSEFWLHRTHGVDMPIFDLSINPQLGSTGEDITELNKELSNNSIFPNNNKWFGSDHAVSLAEKGASPHWHIFLKDIVN